MCMTKRTRCGLEKRKEYSGSLPSSAWFLNPDVAYIRLGRGAEGFQNRRLLGWQVFLLVEKLEGEGRDIVALLK